MSEPTDFHPEHNMLLRKLRSISPLSKDETHNLQALRFTTKSFAPDQVVVREGDRPSECCLVVEGFVCRYKFTEEGKRQIFSFHTPGDIPDLQSLNLKVMDHSMMTMTPCKLAFIEHDNLTRVFRQCPRIADLMWRDTLIDAAIFREWMVGIGRRSHTRALPMSCAKSSCACGRLGWLTAMNASCLSRKANLEMRSDYRRSTSTVRFRS